MESLLNYDGGIVLDWETALLCTLVAFLLSSVIAKVYEHTHQGLSYSRSLIQALVLGSIVGCVIMLAIGDNVARSIGIVGSLAIIRFRTNLRDPRDMVFVFAAIGIGVACGVQSFVSAMVGTVVFAGASVVLWKSGIGSRRRHDGMLRFQAPSEGDASDRVAEALRGETSHFTLVTMTHVGAEMVDCSYQVRLDRAGDPTSLVNHLQEIDGVRSVSYMSQTTAVEV